MWPVIGLVQWQFHLPYGNQSITLHCTKWPSELRMWNNLKKNPTTMYALYYWNIKFQSNFLLVYVSHEWMARTWYILLYLLLLHPKSGAWCCWSIQTHISNMCYSFSFCLWNEQCSSSRVYGGELCMKIKMRSATKMLFACNKTNF